MSILLPVRTSLLLALPVLRKSRSTFKCWMESGRLWMVSGTARTRLLAAAISLLACSALCVAVASAGGDRDAARDPVRVTLSGAELTVSQTGAGVPRFNSPGLVFITDARTAARADGKLPGAG